jgi:anti-sigma factor RsiW
MNLDDQTNQGASDATEADTTRRMSASHECPALIELASYADGTLDEDAGDAIELHLARCPACLAAVRDARLARGQGDQSLTFVPAHVLNAAMALVEAPAAAFGKRYSGWMIYTRRVAAVAASLAICLLGYRVGAAISAVNAADAATDDFASAVSFGVLDVSASDSEFFADTSAEALQ